MDNQRERIESLITSGEYVSAYLLAREEKELQQLYAGRIINAVIDDLSETGGRNARERKYYLRSVLLWIFRDFPGLAPIYRSQLREGSVTENTPDLLKFLSMFASASTKTVPKTPDEAAESVKEAMDGVIDDIKTGRADEKVQDFFEAAGEGLRAGIKGMSDFFDALAGTRPESRDDANEIAGSDDHSAENPTKNDI